MMASCYGTPVLAPKTTINAAFFTPIFQWIFLNTEKLNAFSVMITHILPIRCSYYLITGKIQFPWSICQSYLLFLSANVNVAIGQSIAQMYTPSIESVEHICINSYASSGTHAISVEHSLFLLSSPIVD